MRYLIVSDIHGNLEALEAVLADAAGRYDQAICCGDLVGYGADPNAAVEWVRSYCTAAVRGNHDRACTGLEDLDWFNPVARIAALWTLDALSAENGEFARSLPAGPLRVDGFQVLHGAPIDEDQYLVEEDDAGDAFLYLECRIAFFGHTHLQGGFRRRGDRTEALGRVTARQSELAVPIEPGCAYLVNPGSVGQPRDGDPRAGYALLDTEAPRLLLCRVEYDVARAQAKIRAAGLPAILADRLTSGR